MAEDENVDALSMTSELAERLGVIAVSSAKEEDSNSNSSQTPQSSSCTEGATVSSESVPRVPDPASVSSQSLLLPFLHMLPKEVVQASTEVKLELYEALLEAGLKLEALSMIDRIDSAYEALLYVGSKSSDSPLLGSPSNSPHPSIAANSLSLFAGAAHRHPPSRSIEGAMAAIQDSVAHPDNLEQPDPVFEQESSTSENYGASCDGLLSLACSAGFARLTEDLVKLKGSTTFCSNLDTTPLMEACAAGASSTVIKLIDLGADINAQSKTRNTALVYASAGGHPECVRALLKTGKCDVTKANENGHCALMEAASSGNFEIVKLLMEHGAKQQFLTMNSEFKESPLTLAAYKGHEVVVRYLLKVGNGELSDEELHTALMEASMDGHVPVARALLEHGAPVNLSSESYESPLTLACSGGHDILAKLLLEAGAFIEEPNDESYTPLMEAAREGHTRVVKVLLDHGANVNAQTEETGETALTVAACGGYTEVLDYLVRYGGDLELGANTPLMEAAQEGHIGTVIYVIGAARSQEGACPNLQHHMNAALALAADNGHLDVVEFLHRNGADITLEYEGRTPLMKAAKNGYTDIVSFLINNGVDVNYKPQSGNDATALSLACSSGYKDIVRHLLDAGADPNIELKDGVTCILEAAKNGYVEIVELMLDHAFDNKTAAGCIATQTASNNPGTTKNSNLSRRKKASNLNPPSYLPPGLLPDNPLQNTDPTFTDAEWAKVYYGWLAALYNLRHSGPTPPLPSNDRLPLSYDYNLSQPALDVHTQLTAEQVQALASYVATLPVPIGPTGDKPSYPSLSSNSQTSTASTDSIPLSVSSSSPNCPTEVLTNSPKTLSMPSTSAMVAPTNTISNSTQPVGTAISTSKREKIPTTVSSQKYAYIHQPGSIIVERVPISTPSPTNTSTSTSITTVKPNSGAASTATVSTSSGNFLSNTYEAIKKNFSGLPLPSTSNTLPSVLQADSNNLSHPAKSTMTTTTDDGSVTTTVSAAKVESALATDFLLKGWTEAKWGTTVQQFTNPLQPEQRRLIRKKFQDYISLDTHSTPDMNSLKHFIDLFQEWDKPLPAKETELENDPISMCDIMKMIRPSGQVGVSSNAEVLASTLPTSSAQNTASISGSVSAVHRRAHSEGDEAEYAKPVIKTVFNVDKATDSNNDTPLTLACSNGHKEMVNVLVARGANIEHRDKKGFTPLILAATGGHVGVVHALLTAGANIEAQSERTKDTALSLACSGGRKEVVEVLLTQGANKEHRNVSDYTPLSLAASGGYVEIVNMLLNAGAEINSRTGSKLGISPLMLAAMNGHKDATRVLLEKGSDINAQIETNRNTALTLACFQGRTDVVRLLLQYNANVEHRAKTGLTPLMEAANGGYVEVGVLLLDHNADPNTTPVPSSRDTALTIAADKGHDKFVEMLINRGAAIDAKNKKGCTALWLACHCGHLDTVKTLVTFGADVDTQDNRKVSALLIAFRKGHLKVVEYLVNYVKQFPNQQEMVRYLSTLTTGDQKVTKELQDLLCNVQKCITVIVSATKAQAEQANKAAESLLALLAEEEEMAKNKKQKKQKKKEERRAKKKKNGEKSKVCCVQDVSPKKDQSPSREESEVESEEESESSKKFNQTNFSASVPENDETLVVDRVPLLNVEQNGASLTEATAVSAKQKRQCNRKARQPELTIASPIVSVAQPAVSSISTIKTPPALPVTLVKISPTTTDEWVKASKKKQSKTKILAVPTPSAILGHQKESHVDEAYGNWKDVECRRNKSKTLCVGSSVIARVIGRGGFNINAIREATGASIEVEKQGLKKEQHDRQIFIKGTQDTVLNAALMINGLIADNDASVTDIIRQVLHGNTSVASSSSESGSRTNDGKPSINLVNAGKSTQTWGTTNVWQQRMAARQQQQDQLQQPQSPPSDDACGHAHSQSPPVIIHKQILEHEVRDESIHKSVVSTSQFSASEVEASLSPTPSSSIVESEPVAIIQISRPLSPKEEDLRKAPGYRPHMQANSVVFVEKSQTSAKTESPSILSTIGGQLPLLEEKSVSAVLPGLEHNSFLDKTTHAKLAQIWGSASELSTVNESAWNSQILLNNLGLGLDTSRSDWPLSSESDFLGVGFPPASSQPKPNPIPASVSTSVNEWMAPGNKAGLSFSNRSQNRTGIMHTSPQQTSNAAPVLQTPHQTRTFASNQQTENNVLFNQLAAQLLTHQGSASTSNSNPYFSYNEPSSIGPLKPVTPIHNPTPKPFSSYQNATQEYENLHSLLNSSYQSHNMNSHSSSDFNGQQTYPSSNAVSRTVLTSRPAVPFIPPPPPPGFGAVAPPPNMGANTSVPPPPMRSSFFNNQLPPPPHSSSFMYSSQQAGGNWNPIPPSNIPQQQMPWSGGWK